ncbi:sugar ABC transporter ATP-binding protein [Arthrobacter sp. FX8]|uniref:sugar ABC transporter ATP-binding protein n=1 Tax=Arthrobacter sp. FX8 TaxID=2997335 RepID=UPI00227B6F7D|nr:sugar ABC transporter ATP-binding protein [Arthrobacter sp. FX8]WAJ33009.1 sugar ABC transporter ATP-binding protein [Arthrobacter sp. FX8]
MAKATLPSPSQSLKAETEKQEISVEIKGAAKSFGETRALRGANFSAAAGEIHAIVGENGSGKSTLAKIMSGIVLPDEGTILINGRTVRNPSEALSTGIATVFQEVLVAEGASIADNVFIGIQGLWRSRISRKEQNRRSAELLETLMGHPVNPLALVDTLSLADRQWVTIARALIRSPKVVIFDESTAALDLPGAARLYSEMERLRSVGACVIIVTHRIAELTTFADRATVLRDGINVGVLSGDEITENRLIELMTGVASEKGLAGGTHHQRVRNLSRENVALKADGLVATPGARPSDFELRGGEIVGFAGLDGQGQAEFLQALTGVRPAISGEVTALDGDGRPAPITSLAKAIESKVEYISGDRRKEGIFPNLSILENFGMPLYQKHRRGMFIDRKAISSRFKDMSSMLKLRAGASSNPITSLSGGNQQKVLIGRVLAQGPRVVALNDPARGVDIGTKRELYSQLDTLAGTGAGVIYLSTEIDELIGLCDRVAVFRDGALLGWLSGEQITSDRVLSGMFGHLESNFDVEKALVEQS